MKNGRCLKLLRIVINIKLIEVRRRNFNLM